MQHPDKQDNTNRGALFGLNTDNEPCCIYDDTCDYYEGPYNLNGDNYRMQMNMAGAVALVTLEGKIYDSGTWEDLASDSDLVGKLVFDELEISVFEKHTEKHGGRSFYQLAQSREYTKPDHIERVF